MRAPLTRSSEDSVWRVAGETGSRPTSRSTTCAGGARPASTTARPHLEDGIWFSEQTQDLANLAYFLEAVAVVEAAEGRYRRVAGFLGAARGLREQVGATVYAYYVPDEELRSSAERRARTGIGGDDAFDDAVDVGAGLAVHEIVRLALGGDPG